MLLPLYILFETKVKIGTKIDPPKNENNVEFLSSCITCFMSIIKIKKRVYQIGKLEDEITLIQARRIINLQKYWE